MSQRWVITSDCGGEYRCRGCGARFWEGEGEHRHGCEFLEDFAEAEAEAATENNETKETK